MAKAQYKDSSLIKQSPDIQNCQNSETSHLRWKRVKFVPPELQFRQLGKPEDTETKSE